MAGTDSQMSNDVLTAFVDFLVESWRFSKVFAKMLEKLDAGQQQRYVGKYQWYMKKMELDGAKAELKIVNVEGQIYDPGMAATPLNLDEFATAENLVVEQMVEPIIMGAEGIVRTGTVILRRVEA